MSNQFFIHIGMPKTATTFLQNKIFPELDCIHYLGRTNRTGPVDVLAMRLCKHDSAAWRLADLQTSRDQLLERFKGDRPFLLSIEDFSTVRSALLLDSHRGDRLVDRAVIARRLRELFPGAHILVTIRKHCDILRSYFLYLLKRNNRIVAPASWFEGNRHHGGMLEAFYYCGLLDLYEAEFGPDSVTVLLYEELTRDFSAIVSPVLRSTNAPSGAVEALTAWFAARAPLPKENLAPGRDVVRRLSAERRTPAVLRPFVPAVIKNRLVRDSQIDHWYSELESAIESVLPMYDDDLRKLEEKRPDLGLRRAGYFDR